MAIAVSTAGHWHVASIEETCGARPRGWYGKAPPSLNTRGLLVEEGGFLYDSDSFADDLPYFVEVLGTQHLVIPYSFVTNDSRYLPGQGFATPSDFLDNCRRAFDVLWREGGRGTAGRPAISADGRYAAFATASRAVLPGERDRWSDVVRVHLPTGRLAEVSVSRKGGPADEDSVAPSLSANGRYVAFSSWADNLAPGGGVDHDVFLRDMRTRTTYLVSRGLDGTPVSVSGGRQAAVDDSGRAVVYQTWASNIAPGDTNDEPDVVLWRW